VRQHRFGEGFPEGKAPPPSRKLRSRAALQIIPRNLLKDDALFAGLNRWLPVSMIKPLIFLLLAFILLGFETARGDWKAVTVPSSGISGAAKASWYRCFIRVPDSMVTPQEKDLFRDSITLSVGGIRGQFVILLNGREIVRGSEIPDDQRRRFKVPRTFSRSRNSMHSSSGLKATLCAAV